MLLRVLDVRRKAKRFISAPNLNELKKKVRPDTLKVKGVYLKACFAFGALHLLR